MSGVLGIVIGFALGWFIHRRRVYWATITIRGVLEQWIEDEIRGRLDLLERTGRRSTVLGSQSLETLDGMVAESLKAHWPRRPLRRLWITLFYRPEKASVRGAVEEGGT